MIRPLNEYKTLVFDCDGVVLNSNRVKTSAFYEAALSHGEEAAVRLVSFHKANGGVSRYKKFSYFLDEIVPTYGAGEEGALDFEGMLQVYASAVRKGLLECEVASGLSELRLQTREVRWLIASGGDQSELRDTFKTRDIDKMFDGGVYGSPDTKEEILRRELEGSNILQPALFLGDSKYDFEAANGAGLDFVFISDWSEVDDIESWVEKEGIVSIANIQELCSAT